MKIKCINFNYYHNYTSDKTKTHLCFNCCIQYMNTKRKCIKQVHLIKKKKKIIS
jgi:hypothetical protein